MKRCPFLIPGDRYGATVLHKTPIENLWLNCMAQVYPQDRGMNYAIVYGQQVVKEMMQMPASKDLPAD